MALDKVRGVIDWQVQPIDEVPQFARPIDDLSDMSRIARER